MTTRSGAQVALKADLGVDHRERDLDPAAPE